MLTTLSPSRHTTGRAGELKLTFAVQDHETILAKRFHRVPFQVMRPIYDGAGYLGVYVLSPTGGVVQGDTYNVDITARQGSHALLTTQAATKVYRMPHGCAHQTTRLAVERGAVFEYLPDALILFNDSDFVQTAEVTLHPGALLLWQEIVMPGRLARGEVMQFRRYSNRLIVRDANGLLLYESATVEPSGLEDVSRLGQLEGYPCWGNWYLLGDNFAAEDFCRAHSPILSGDTSLGGLSPLHRRGIAGRMISRTLAPIMTAFERLRGIVRTEIVGLAAPVLRK